MTKPFLVNVEWLDYAHGSAAEEGQPLAVDLMALAEGATVRAGSVPIPVDRFDLVREIVSVAELYTSDSAVQDDDRMWFRMYPAKLIARARVWLALHQPTAPVPMTNAQRQAAFRVRQAMLKGACEVRGIWLEPRLHEQLKAYAAKLAKQAPAA